MLPRRDALSRLAMNFNEQLEELLVAFHETLPRRCRMARVGSSIACWKERDVAFLRLVGRWCFGRFPPDRLPLAAEKLACRSGSGSCAIQLKTLRAETGKYVRRPKL